MKRLTILFVIFLPFCMFAQTSDRQMVSLSVGASLPTGDFNKQILKDSTSGFAKTGIAMSFNYTYRITHNFGVQAVVSYSSNKIDRSEYKSQLEVAHPDYSVSVESTKNWSSGGLMVGPYLTFSLTDNLRWDLRALGGYFGVYSPKITLRTTKLDEPTVKQTYYVNSTKAGDLSYMVGTCLKMKVRSYYVLLSGDYTSSNMKFKDASGWDWEGQPYENSFERQISYFSVTIGIGYKL